MSPSKRQRILPTEQWEQLELLVTSPEQRAYELIRPVVLFGQSAAQRARESADDRQISAGTVQRRPRPYVHVIHQAGTTSARSISQSSTL